MLRERFENLLLATGREGMADLLKFINDSDFYRAPASSRFHGAHQGGLLEHSLQVNKDMMVIYDAFRERGKLKDGQINLHSIIIASLLHDICKVDFYKSDVRNVKNNGVWEQVPYYTIDDKLPLGHGEKSVMILQQYIELTTDEMYAIRWHMGGFDDTAKSYAGGLQLSAALDKCPLLVMLHMADLAAVYLINKEG
jgi:hypothetical protein